MSVEILDKLRTAMTAEGLDSIVIMSPENVAWSSGVMVPSQKIVRHRHAIVLVPRQQEPEMVVVDIEEGLVRENASIQEITAYNEFTQTPVLVLAERLTQRGLSQGRIGMETGYLNHQDYQQLADALSGAQIEPVDELLTTLRMTKTQDEIERLTRAGRLAEQVAYQALQSWWPGMTEADLGRVITDKFSAGGGDKLTMLSVTAGDRTPILNGGPTQREICRGEVVRIDVIGTADNYCCDVARTAVVGEPTAELQDIWQKLVDCRDLALEHIRAGVSSHSLFQEYIQKMDGWNLPTLNFLGHGLGLTLHEQPYLNRYSDCRLEAGMVLAVEPLVCFPELGMQLEEAVIVTESGCQLITDQFDTRQLWQMEERSNTR